MSVALRARLSVPARLALGIGAVGAAALAWGVLVERNSFHVRRESVPVLAPGSRSIVVLHLSDIHLAPWQHAKQQWIRSLVDLEPDLIVNTGDNLGHPDSIDALSAAFAPFGRTPGVFVHGSNDYHGPQLKNPFTYFTGPSQRRTAPPALDTPKLERVLADHGWLNLNNAATRLTIKGSPLEFVGVNDPHIGFDRLDKLPGALDELRENQEWADGSPTPDAVTIGVTHAPYRRVLNSLVTNGADMIFAGHTHGGQVCVPGYGALVTNCDIPRGQVSGLSLWHHGLKASYLNISAGIGTSIYAPVRFACRPEAIVVTLEARAA